MNSRWAFHHAALAPLLPGASALSTRKALDVLFGGIPTKLDRRTRVAHMFETMGREGRALNFLVAQGLASFWHRQILEQGLADAIGPGFMKGLYDHRMRVAANYRMQRYHMAQLRRLLDDAGVAHLIFKGAHLRECVYSEPGLRDACDLDVLIRREDRMKVIALFRDQGYVMNASRENVSHEVTLSGQGGIIDLHWDLLRPGRTRVPVARAFLDSRRDCGSHWGPDDEAALFLMLVHPVFAKYGTAPQSALVRVLDMYWWLEKVRVDWDSVLHWLERAGLCTAAWITLQWLYLFGEPEVPEWVAQRLRPGAVRAGWLGHWVEQDLSTRCLNRPWLVQGAFTLPAHDRLKDALRVLRLRRQWLRDAGDEMALLESGDHG